MFAKKQKSSSTWDVCAWHYCEAALSYALPMNCKWYHLSNLFSFSLYISLSQPKLLDEKQTTIYKRAVDKNYHLKMKASRFIFSEINQKFPIMPFSARCKNFYLIHSMIYCSTERKAVILTLSISQSFRREAC
jgi:hypothetical protein